jgi:ribosomal protein S5
MSFSCLVLIGNGTGTAALGYGRAVKITDAVREKQKNNSLTMFYGIDFDCIQFEFELN